MLHYLIELAIWCLGFFFAGCCIGCLLRKLFGTEAAVEAPAVAAAAPAVAAAMPRPAAPAPAPQPVAAPMPRMTRPRGLPAARDGKADNLLRISGVGPANEKILHNLGIFHFDQIANWTQTEVDWVDDHLKFNGRIQREEWINQARLLAAGNEAEFAKLYGTGGEGAKEAGLRTVRGPRENEASALMSADNGDGGGKLSRPRGISGARGGKADNLQRISGIGPKNEKILHGLGIYHFDQIAAWTATEVNWVDDHLKFNGRIRREEWIRQARLLAEGKDDEFKRLYGTGGLRNKQGEKLSGSRTRR